MSMIHMYTKTELVRHFDSVLTLREVKTFWTFRKIKGHRQPMADLMLDLKPSGIKALWNRFGNPYRAQEIRCALKLQVHSRHVKAGLIKRFDRFDSWTNRTRHEDRLKIRAQSLAYDLLAPYIPIINEYPVLRSYGSWIKKLADELRHIQFFDPKAMQKIEADLSESMASFKTLSQERLETLQRKSALNHEIFKIDKDLRRMEFLTDPGQLHADNGLYEKLIRAKVLGFDHQQVDDLIKLIGSSLSRKGKPGCDQPAERMKIFFKDHPIMVKLESKRDALKIQGVQLRDQVYDLEGRMLFRSLIKKREA